MNVKNKEDSILRESLRLSSIQEKILIALTKDEFLYGKQIVDTLEEATGLPKIISSGSLYPTLSRLEKKHLVKSIWEEFPDDNASTRKKFYSITKKGELTLDSARELREMIESF